MRTRKKDDWFEAYKCPRCNNLNKMDIHETRAVIDMNDIFIVYSKNCRDCGGTGIQPIPYWELKGVTYEAWRETAEAVSEGST